MIGQPLEMSCSGQQRSNSYPMMIAESVVEDASLPASMEAVDSTDPRYPRTHHGAVPTVAHGSSAFADCESTLVMCMQLFDDATRLRRIFGHQMKAAFPTLDPPFDPTAPVPYSAPKRQPGSLDNGETAKIKLKTENKAKSKDKLKVKSKLKLKVKLDPTQEPPANTKSALQTQVLDGELIKPMDGSSRELLELSLSPFILNKLCDVFALHPCSDFCFD